VKEPEISKGIEPRRIFLRVPIKLPAKIFLKGSFYKKVYVNNLSTTGFSFDTPEADFPSGLFEVHLRLGHYFSRLIKTQAESKNRTALQEGVRIGCRFLNLSEQEQNAITALLRRQTDIGAPRQFIGIASLLLTFDASWRILAFLVNYYYNATPLGRGLSTPLVPDSYITILIAYFFFSLSAFILIERIIKLKEKTRFLLGTFCLIPGFIFLVTKNIAYWKLAITRSDYLIRLFSLAQLLIILYTVSSMLIGIFSFKKIRLILDNIEHHQQALENA
jgi:hypothetical protein